MVWVSWETPELHMLESWEMEKQRINKVNQDVILICAPTAIYLWIGNSPSVVFFSFYFDLSLEEEANCPWWSSS